VKKLPLLKLAAGAVVILIIGLAVLHGTDWRTWVASGLGRIQGAGPWAFFGAMALLPAFGVPMLLFSLTSASAFAPEMGMGGVVAASIAAMTANLLLSYWLARWALRPWLARLMERCGYRLPKVESGDITDLIVILRLTPGVPFFVQNYLLGLADAPVGRYLLLSCLLGWPNLAAFTIFGNALRNGRGGTIIAAAGLLVAVVAGTHMIRRHLKGRSDARSRASI
jgi:uncharacterized membrane protein YdjX (TVP38/TMEM64 family)